MSDYGQIFIIISTISGITFENGISDNFSRTDTLPSEEIENCNFIAVGDFSCNKESIKTLKDIISQVKQTKM